MHKFKGKVVRGKGRGKDLGFPTANIAAPEGVEDGIYVATIHFNTLTYCSIVFIGSAETFGEQERRAEIYILDFSESLYDQQIEVELIKKIRESKKFDSTESLIEQMKDDELVAREFFKNYNQSN